MDIAKRFVVTVVLLACWPVMCVAAALYVTGLVVNGVLGEWTK